MDASQGKKRAKRSNFSAKERETLALCIQPFKNVIEKVANDSASVKEKNKAWESIVRQFRLQVKDNSITVAQTKGIWKRMKVAGKKEEREFRKKQRQTGGGEPPAPVSIETSLVMGIAPSSFVLPPTNTLDSDEYGEEVTTVPDTQLDR